MPSLLLRFLSFLYPVPVRKGSSDFNPRLELYLFRGNYQLGTPEAMYSSGRTYEPLVFAFREMGTWLKEVNSILLLGTGLASAVHILQSKSLSPKVRMVDIDPVVLDWAMEFLPEAARPNVETVCADAIDFVLADTAHYDMLIVDVFIGRKVPAAITERAFLEKCRDRLLPGGKLVLNYMVEKKGDEFLLKGTLEAIFPKVNELGFGENRVFVAAA